jgi:hypothetical protein
MIIFIMNCFLRSLIIRVYQPAGLSKKKSQCIIHTQGLSYRTNVFTLDVLTLGFLCTKFIYRYSFILETE